MHFCGNIAAPCEELASVAVGLGVDESVVVVDGAVEEVAVAAEGEEEEAATLLVEELAALLESNVVSTTQMLLLLQVMPLGQHLSPQLCIGVFNCVVNIGLVGFLVTSCQSRLQSIVEMVLQSFPAGQQITDRPLLKT